MSDKYLSQLLYFTHFLQEEVVRQRNEGGVDYIFIEI